ncbi:MAG TPA: hypothetical protein PKW95_16710 [bacterium]|nr:hypothetical protein [bacterium]
MRLPMLLMIVLFACVAFAAEPLGHFDAGTTIHLRVGESVTIVLERSTAEEVQWLWPHRPDYLLAHRPGAVQTDEEHGRIVETHVFTALTPGADIVFAEKVSTDDPTVVIARYIVTVQVEP